jgi:Ca2+:H+ antiporter
VLSIALRWTVAVPVVAALVLAATWGTKPAAVVLVLVALLLAGSVLAAVHHAEVVAHRVGEPYGSLVLAVAVTVIEVALIVTLMASGGSETDTLARDTVFAAVMITCNGIVGMSLLVGALRRRVASFNAEGTATALATVSTLATLSLVLPTFTTSAPGPSSPRRSSRSLRRRRSRCTRCSSSSRPSAIATTSCRSRLRAASRRSTRSRRPTGSRW